MMFKLLLKATPRGMLVFYKMRPSHMIFMGAIMFFIIYKTTNFQYEQAEMETRSHPFDSITESHVEAVRIGYLPQGIVESNSDLELKPLWFTRSSKLKVKEHSHRNLLAMAVGIKQKKNVDAIVNKFVSENFTVILFHYDGNVNGWYDLWWSNRAIHVVAHKQTKWWFAKHFLHPDVVSIYNYIFLWDEALGASSFHPTRYVKVMESEGLEISLPALDPYLSQRHHRVTLARKKRIVHRRTYDSQGRSKCSSGSDGPPCTGWVEGRAPVFSRSVWPCVWNLIQNDRIHGWGMGLKLGDCTQGGRTKKVGVIDNEFIVHYGVQNLGESSTEKRGQQSKAVPSGRRHHSVKVVMSGK